jgi:hypothetical protein
MEMHCMQGAELLNGTTPPLSTAISHVRCGGARAIYSVILDKSGK